ncbi:hypothetical protein DH09_01020 (plasmid) [Bacillaceae bacterium JMAK1]|nr:hypothetical protein DH09_01020 [Bacillaceae bacterium JMAK1]
MGVEEKLAEISLEVYKRYNVEILFHPEAKKDLKKQIGMLPLVLNKITTRAKAGPLIKPEGVGESLTDELVGFCKIKNIKLPLIEVKGS